VIRAPASPPAGAADPRLAEASRALEAMLLKQIVRASGVFKGGEGAGSAVREGLFADALSDAVARAGGIGLADQVARSLGAPGAEAPAPAPLPWPAPSPLPGRPRDSGAEGSLGELLLDSTRRVTSGFGSRRDPFSGEFREHDGIDLGAPEGTPVRVPAGGVVRSAGPRGGYGNAIEIDHGHGLTTLYGHAADLLVFPGETVHAGQAIATVGSTGRSTGPHLHFEVRVDGRPLEPNRALKQYGLRAEGSVGADPDHRRTP
jgi:murein DD-endopeptidase MepM/ murein hydrolase activator NlpD